MYEGTKDRRRPESLENDSQSMAVVFKTGFAFFLRMIHLYRSMSEIHI